MISVQQPQVKPPPRKQFETLNARKTDWGCPTFNPDKPKGLRFSGCPGFDLNSLFPQFGSDLPRVASLRQRGMTLGVPYPFSF